MGRRKILVYGGDTLAGSCALPQDKLYEEACTYSFGTLSDVHFNRYNKSGQGDDAMITFPAALDFLDAFGVTMVGMSGDLSGYFLQLAELVMLLCCVIFSKVVLL